MLLCKEKLSLHFLLNACFSLSLGYSVLYNKALSRQSLFGRPKKSSSRKHHAAYVKQRRREDVRDYISEEREHAKARREEGQS